jgi:hypothetical protein
VEHVFAALLEEAQDPTVDPVALVFNLVAVLGDPAEWSALHAVFFERILLTVGVLPQHVNAMRSAQAHYRRVLADVTAWLTAFEQD